ncbi:four helix bundle protein [Novipirellula sp.]|uniref:four helix bundle protein n=1 Tax=Novipirellula sp. TaxID=2795430 RepID=UPI003567C9F6
MKTDLLDRTFAFAKPIVKLSQTLQEQRGVPQTLGSQLVRSGTAIGANVEEGQASQTRKNLRLKYNIACKEPRETLH